MPQCEDGRTLVLKNPGECQPIHECGRSFELVADGRALPGTFLGTQNFPLFRSSVSLQKGRLHSSNPTCLSATPTALSEKDKVL